MKAFNENNNCEDCDFISKTIETRELQVGKCRTDTKTLQIREFQGPKMLKSARFGQ